MHARGEKTAYLEIEQVCSSDLTVQVILIRGKLGNRAFALGMQGIVDIVHGAQKPTKQRLLDTAVNSNAD